MEKRVRALAELGGYLRASQADAAWQKTVDKACAANGFFTPQNIQRAVRQWADLLTQENLQAWGKPYAEKMAKAGKKNIALVMAGNIPLVGFHDYLCVMLCGFSAQIKLSSKDAFLLPFLHEKVKDQLPEVVFTQEQLKDFDAIIATGSGNTFRYFEYYFGKYPHLLRKNRTSCAVLNGRESREDLEKLADDVFSYFGLGCRNVSKLYVPQDFDLSRLAEVFSPYTQDLAQNNGYKNNYDYHKSIFLVNRKPHLDTGAALLVESEALASPMAVVHYQPYRDLPSLQEELETKREQLQCVIGEGGLPFGTAQQPGLADYADGENVLEFLLNL